MQLLNFAPDSFVNLLGFLLSFYFLFFCHFLAFRKQTFMCLVIICGNPMYATDRQTDRQRAMLNASTYGAVE